MLFVKHILSRIFTFFRVLFVKKWYICVGDFISHTLSESYTTFFSVLMESFYEIICFLKYCCRVRNMPKISGPVNGDECYFWRTTGCDYGDACRYRHVPQSKGVDKKPWQK